MHLLASEFVSLDDTMVAVDLAHGPCDYVFMSFTDSDLSVFASAWERGPQANRRLRLVNLARLKHPYSIDLYLEKTLSQAKAIIIRLLGGMDYWRYGVEECASLARAKNIDLAIVPGDHVEDPRLDAASTLETPILRAMWTYFQNGGVDNLAACQALLAHRGAIDFVAKPIVAAACGLFAAACYPGAANAPHALLLLYRSIYLAGDTAPILALAGALAQRGFGVSTCYVTSLKDPAATARLTQEITTNPPSVVLNTTAFAARADGGQGFVLDACTAPVLQVVLASGSHAQWQASPRGLSSNDLAMNVVLPELDGRIHAGTISFKGEAALNPATNFTHTLHQAEPAHIAHVADLARAYAMLGDTPAAQRKVACILSDYPGKSGRTGYAVGLDTPQSVIAIADFLRNEGYTISALPPAQALITALAQNSPEASLSFAEYNELLPEALRQTIFNHWGELEADPFVQDQAFHFAMVRAGNLLIAVQPARGPLDQRGLYHDLATPPCHAYVAFYLMLRAKFKMHVMLHCGTHGTLEWLPGKAMALSPACAPQALIGPTPVIYPFIVNNPGEAAQAKRRIGAVTIGHMTPKLILAGHHGAALEIEAMLDEYAQAQSLDKRRAALLGAAILDRAAAAGLIDAQDVRTSNDQLQNLDAWLCDVKEMRIGDGLHIFGEATYSSELTGLASALRAEFVAPGPAGAPEQGREDVLPTGRNLFTCDPRAIPSRTAWEIGARTAAALTQRYAQDHGEWPKHVFLDLWGSASLRTGGDDLAQAFALLGVRPTWDAASTRVSGFEILPLAKLERARVEVTLRISGLFRDMFPTQIALFDAAVQAVAALEETVEDNPLKARISGPSIFGPAPQSYGMSIINRLAVDPFASASDLGQDYLAENAFSYGQNSEGLPAREALEQAVTRCDAFVHVQDMVGQDVLDSDAFVQSEGGFAAAAHALGRSPAQFHADTSNGTSIIRTMPEEIARVVQARASNPLWLAGQMRHGHRGAAEIANNVENLFAFAAMTQMVPSRHFETLFLAICGAQDVREFLIASNPQAANAIARCFGHALARGFWQNRRNSVAAILAQMEGKA